MSPILGSLILQVILIAINSFFAASEIAVISLNEGKLRRQAEDGDKKAKKMLQSEITSKIYELDSAFEAWLEREYESLLQALKERRQLWSDAETQALEKNCESQKSARDWDALEGRVDGICAKLFAKGN